MACNKVDLPSFHHDSSITGHLRQLEAVYHMQCFNRGAFSRHTMNSLRSSMDYWSIRSIVPSWCTNGFSSELSWCTAAVKMRDLTSTEENDTPQLSAGDNLGNTYDGLVLTNTSCQGKPRHSLHCIHSSLWIDALPGFSLLSTSIKYLHLRSVAFFFFAHHHLQVSRYSMSVRPSWRMDIGSGI